MTVEAAAKQRQIADRILPFLEMENGAEHGTDNSKLSVVVKQENDRLWKAGEKNFVLKGAPMLDVITHKCGPAAVAGVRLRHSVTAIDFSAAAAASESGAGSVRVTVRDLASGADTVHEVDKVLVTVSLGVLQARAIAVSPPLPADVQQLIDAQGIDAGIKLTLKFKRRFWPKYMGAMRARGISEWRQRECCVNQRNHLCPLLH
jgi:hypothetical protein